MPKPPHGRSNKVQSEPGRVGGAPRANGFVVSRDLNPKLVPVADLRPLGRRSSPSPLLPMPGELEGRIGAQPVEIIGVLVAAGDRKDSGAQDIGHGVPDPLRIAPVADRRGEPVGQLQAPLGRGQQHNAAVRGDPSAVEGDGDLLASNGWKRERQQRIVGHGGCGWLDAVDRVGFNNRILRHINRLGHIRQPLEPAVMNKTG